jgi:hypothetical protein
MSAGNGKDAREGFVEVVGNPVAPRRGKAPKPAPRARDQHLPGMEPKTVPAIHKAIEEYVVARDHRMELTKIEVQKKAILMHEMKQAGLLTYRVDGHEAELVVDEQVKARLGEPEEEDAEPVGRFVEPAKPTGPPNEQIRKGGRTRNRPRSAEARA